MLLCARYQESCELEYEGIQLVVLDEEDLNPAERFT